MCPCVAGLCLQQQPVGGVRVPAEPMVKSGGSRQPLQAICLGVKGGVLLDHPSQPGDLCQRPGIAADPETREGWGRSWPPILLFLPSARPFPRPSSQLPLGPWRCSQMCPGWQHHLAVPGRHLVVPGYCASSCTSKMLVLGAGRACFLSECWRVLPVKCLGPGLGGQFNLHLELVPI